MRYFLRKYIIKPSGHLTHHLAHVIFENHLSLSRKARERSPTCIIAGGEVYRLHLPRVADARDHEHYNRERQGLGYII